MISFSVEHREPNKESDKPKSVTDLYCGVEAIGCKETFGKGAQWNMENLGLPWQ